MTLAILALLIFRSIKNYQEYSTMYGKCVIFIYIEDYVLNFKTPEEENLNICTEICCMGIFRYLQSLNNK